jgi:hypothetical protein
MAAKTSMKVLYEFPKGTTAPNDGVSFWRYVRFEYGIRDHGWCRRAIEFKGVVARRERGESCSTEWHYEADDRLIEIEDSDWLKEICADTRKDWRHLCEKKHHYMITLRDMDTVELIADSWELLPEEKGEWPKIRLK